MVDRLDGPSLDCQSDVYPTDFLDIGNTVSVEYHEKYYRYMVARYSAFVDVWELFNEWDDENETYGPVTAQGLDADWKVAMATFIREKAPYHDLVCTNANDGHSVSDAWQDLHTSHKSTLHVDNTVCIAGNDCLSYDPTACARTVDAFIDSLTRFSGKPDIVDEFGPANNTPNNDPDQPSNRSLDCSSQGYGFGLLGC